MNVSTTNGRFTAPARARWRVRCACLAVLVLLPPAARADEVKGRVTSSDGTPVFNADFNVYDAASGEKLAFSDKTDATGAYKLVLDAGRYTLLLRPPINSGYAPRIRRAVGVSGVLVMDWVVPVAAQVRGLVTDTIANGVTGVDINFDRADDGSRQPALGTLTSPFGTFVAVIEPGTYNITFNPPPSSGLAPVRLRGQPAPPADVLSVTLPPAVFLSGVIRDQQGVPVAGAKLVFDDASNVRTPSSAHVSATDGSFMTGIAAGVYRVLVEPPVGSRFASVRSEGVDLTYDAARTFTLPIGAVVTGSVLDRRGRPVVGADWDVAEETASIGVPTPGDNTDSNGDFRFVVSPGSFKLTLSPPAGSGLDTLVYRNVPIARDTVFTVDYSALGGSGSTAEAQLVARKNPTHSTAVFALVVHAPVANALIEIFDVSGRRVRVLHEGVLAAGARTLFWDGRHDNGAQAHTGVYLVRARLDGREHVTRFVMLP